MQQKTASLEQLRWPCATPAHARSVAWRAGRRRSVQPVTELCFTSGVACSSDPRGRTKWYGVYTEEQYAAQRQSEERAKWAASVRTITGNLDQAAWAGSSPLDPPALLSGVAVVIVSPRKPVTVGTVARACGSFECEDLRIVMPRQESYITRRHAKSASKGAQYILYRAGHYDSIQEATSDCDVRIAFTRWAQSSSPHVFKVDINGLTSHPAVQAVVRRPLLTSEAAPPPPPSAPWTEEAAAAAAAAEARLEGPAAAPPPPTHPSGSEEASEADEEAADGALSTAPVAALAAAVAEHSTQCCRQGSDNTSAARSHNDGGDAGPGPGSAAASSAAAASASASSAAALPRPPKVALVFGREELGLSDEEVDSCEVVCSVPIGRLQESLSLSHAVSIALCALYQARLNHLAATGADGVASSPTSSAAAGAGAAQQHGRGAYAIDASTGSVRAVATAAAAAAAAAAV